MRLVRLTRSVNIEIAKAENLSSEVVVVGAHILVEQELGIAIDIQWRFKLALFPKDASTSVDRRAGGIEKGNVTLLAIFEQRDGVAIIVFHHVAAVGFHGV
jgi:hypothetical protein